MAWAGIPILQMPKELHGVTITIGAIESNVRGNAFLFHIPQLAQMPKELRDVKIAILTCPFEPPKPKTKHKARMAAWHWAVAGLQLGVPLRAPLLWAPSV